MERKIGEIFEYNGEWYQCIIGHCNQCSFDEAGTCKFIGNPYCAYRNDKKLACFKKLGKVGEPFTCNIHGDERLVWMQEYKLYDVNFCKENALLMYVSDYKHKRIAIEIKQIKEDMEEKNLNLKPFDIQKAREGKPVCTRDGHKARIICFDGKGDQPIIALVEAKGNKDALIEKVERYFINGHSVFEVRETNNDLMMLPEKKEGWVNVYKRENEYICENECNVSTGIAVYKSEGEAKRNIDKNEIYVNTIKINWSE